MKYSKKSKSMRLIDKYINDQHRNIPVYERKHKLIANELQKRICKRLQDIAKHLR